MNVGVVRNGVQTIIPQASWNVDTLNGSGPSGKTLDMSRGNIFRIAVAWCGFAAIVFEVVLTDSSGNQVVQPVHRWAPAGQTSVMTPNLPNLHGPAERGHGFQRDDVRRRAPEFSLMGGYSPIYRISSIYGSLGEVAARTNTMFSVKRKTSAVGMGLKIGSIDITCTQTVILEIRVNATLGDFTSYSAYLTFLRPVTRACCSCDSTATTVTGGTVIYAMLVTSSSGNALQRPIRTRSITTFPSTSPVTFCTKMLTGTNSYTPTVVVRFKERVLNPGTNLVLRRARCGPGARQKIRECNSRREVVLSVETEPTAVPTVEI